MEVEFKNNVKSITAQKRLHFRLWLRKEFTNRCKRNPRYSLRAFATLLDIDPSSLSQILSGKRSFSKKVILHICEKLAVVPQDLKKFGLTGPSQGDENCLQLHLDTFAIISDWYHYAILELTEVIGFKADPAWVSKKIGISLQEAKLAIDRLKRLGLLHIVGDSLVRSSSQVTNQSTISTSAAHKLLQRQIINKALLAIEECSSEEKDITSMTMAIDESHLSGARELIKQFRRDLCAFLEDGTKTRVYNLAIQLYPLSRK
ncbi:MAG: TIGR02147 family protein [Sulfuricurvum sp.]